MENDFFIVKGGNLTPKKRPPGDEPSRTPGTPHLSGPLKGTDVCCPEEQFCEHVAELGRSNHVKDRFLAILAHELRTPLASMLNAVELLRTQQPGNAVEVIERQARHMARLVDDILDISRVSSGKITLRKTKFDLVQAVQKTAQAALFSCMKQEKHFKASLWPEPLWVEADLDRIEQVITNLLTNAAKYTDITKEGAKIWLKLTREKDHALLQVRDEGIGIPADMLERIFEPFVQLEASVARSRGGLGLGLALVRQLVGMHGGTVTVQSAGLGHGAEFSVRLPLATVAGPCQESSRPLEEKTHPLPGVCHRILLVEDNPDMASTLARLLTHWGHMVKVESSGSTALDAALEFHPDIALVDIGLPGIDGYLVARQLSQEPQLKGLHLIAMSGYGQEADRNRAKEAGFEDYMLKPVEPEVLRERLAQ